MFYDWCLTELCLYIHPQLYVGCEVLPGFAHPWSEEPKTITLFFKKGPQKQLSLRLHTYEPSNDSFSSCWKVRKFRGRSGFLFERNRFGDGGKRFGFNFAQQFTQIDSLQIWKNKINGIEMATFLLGTKWSTLWTKLNNFVYKMVFNYSIIGMGFLNPMLRLKRWDMTSCMQLENRDDR